MRFHLLNRPCVQALLLAALPSLSLPQVPPSAPVEVKTQDAPATFSTKVNLVLVPVVVRDRDGKTVGTLRQENFQLFDKGKLQVIAKFSVEQAAGRLIPVSTEAAPKPGPPDPTQPATPATSVAIPEHFFAYLFDDVHLEFGNLAQVRDAAWKHLSSTLKPADRAAIYTTSGQIMLDFTDDRDKLHETLLRLRPAPIARASAQECPDISFYQADLIKNRNDPLALNVAAQETLSCMNLDPSQIATARQISQSSASRVLSAGEQETRVSLSVLNDIVRRMTATPGQRTIILVSPGFIRLNDQLQDETAIIDRAIRGNITINSLDARGLYTDTSDISKRTLNGSVLSQKLQYERDSARQSSDVLAEFADGTGGSFVQNTNDLLAGFKTVAEPPQFYYVLGFSPQNLKLDGSYHALKVSLKPSSGLTVKARRGFYAPRHLADADEEAKEEISQALFSRDEMSDIPIDLHTQFFKSSAASAQLAVVARIDVRKLRFRKADGRNGDEMMVVAGLFDRNGNYIQGVTKKIQMRLKDDTLAEKLNAGVQVRLDYKIAPGTYVIRLVVRDAEGQMMAARNGAVEIPY